MESVVFWGVFLSTLAHRPSSRVKMVETASGVGELSEKFVEPQILQQVLNPKCESILDSPVPGTKGQTKTLCRHCWTIAGTHLWHFFSYIL